MKKIEYWFMGNKRYYQIVIEPLKTVEDAKKMRVYIQMDLTNWNNTVKQYKETGNNFIISMESEMHGIPIDQYIDNKTNFCEENLRLIDEHIKKLENEI